MRNIKNITFITTLFLALAGCANNQAQPESQNSDEEKFITQSLNLKIAAPAGAPAVSLFAHLGENNVEINAADKVQGYMSDASDKDIVILPTNYGVNMITNKNVSFKLAATITFGNFYLLSTGLDDNNTLDEGDKVLAFQQNGVGGKLFNYVYGDKNLDVTYALDAASVKDAILLADETFDYDYALLAQPVVNVVLGKKTGYSIYANVQEDYKTKTGGKEITQASIFVKNNADISKAKEDLNTIKNDVEQLLDNTQNIIDQTSSLEVERVSGKLNGAPTAIKALLDNNNQLGIGFKYALENKANVDAFLSTLGMGETSEEIYFSVK